jgi:hypothetical protein
MRKTKEDEANSRNEGTLGSPSPMPALLSAACPPVVARAVRGLEVTLRVIVCYRHMGAVTLSRGRTGVRVSDLGELRSTVPSCTGEGVEVLQTRLILNRSTSAAAAAVAEIDVTVIVMAVEEREV